LSNNLSLKSPAFKDQAFIPVKYSGEGRAVNPPLIFENVPANAKSLVLIVDDPDAPGGNWDHWLVFNISPAVKEIKEGEVPAGARLGRNDFGQLEYGGPNPPPGKPHRYCFKLYALDAALALKEGAGKKEIERAMTGRILGQARLVGLFKR